jgi:hypothetical protein
VAIYVVGCGAEKRWIVAKTPEPDIASGAKERANPARKMTMIDMWTSFGRVTEARLANRTRATLHFKHRDVAVLR